MVCSKNHNNRPLEEFILVSPAPVDTAAKLSNILIVLSNKEKERAKDLIAAGKFCEAMATELLALGKNLMYLTLSRQKAFGIFLLPIWLQTL